MGKIIEHSVSNLKKSIYKFEDGKLIKEFLGLHSAAFDAGVSTTSMSTYMNKKQKKPRKIPANVEYRYSALEIK